MAVFLILANCELFGKLLSTERRTLEIFTLSSVSEMLTICELSGPQVFTQGISQERFTGGGVSVMLTICELSAVDKYREENITLMVVL